MMKNIYILFLAIFTMMSCTDKPITMNLYYTGENGNALKFVEEMESSGTADAIRAEEGNLRYEYFVSKDDPETVLLIDSWASQKALDVHHRTPMMGTIAALREKYDLTMRAERYYRAEEDLTSNDAKFIREKKDTSNGLRAQIDVHSHAITSSYMEFIKAHGAEMDEGFPIPSWSVDEQLVFMDKAGIETSVLTMPAPQPWFGDGVESAAVCRKFNEACAALKSQYPGRFMFCASLPLPDVECAIEEAVYALDVLGADGVKLASNSYGQYLGDPALDPLMEALNKRKAVIITHPHKPSAVNERLIADVPLASFEYLAETTRAILNMAAHNVMLRYPDLKVVVPHCGSFLPNALPRFKGLLPVMVSQGYMQPVDVDANVSRLYFDLAGAATDDAIRSLLTITTADHLLYGSDYPYVAAQALVGAKASLLQRLPALGLNPQAVFSGNAVKLFGK